jgi:hypothetical protein
MARTPKVNSLGEAQLQKAEQQLDKFTEEVKQLANSDSSPAIKETEPQTKLSSKEVAKTDAPYIKPSRAIFSKEKFDEHYRTEYEEGKKYVKCIVENNEIRGDLVEAWVKKFPGTPAEFYQVPVNRPIYLPKMVADHLASRFYTRFMMADKSPNEIREGEPMQSMVAKEQIRRIDCRPVGFGFSS